MSSPIHLTHVYNTLGPIEHGHDSGGHDSGGPYNNSSQRSARLSKIFGTSSMLTDASSQRLPKATLGGASLLEEDWLSSRSTHANFHVPCNTSNRFLVVSSSKGGRVPYSNFDRLPPPPFGEPGRSSSAPKKARRSATLKGTGTHCTGILPSHVITETGTVN